jgi:hypothetical protein
MPDDISDCPQTNPRDFWGFILHRERNMPRCFADDLSESFERGADGPVGLNVRKRPAFEQSFDLPNCLGDGDSNV